MRIKHYVREFFRKFGYDIIKYNPTFQPPTRIKELLVTYDINLLLDIGANTGEFAQQIRKDFGYTKRIISFEPLSSAFKSLKMKVDNDPNWEALNVALGDIEKETVINIAGNSYSSSLLNMLPIHQTIAPSSKYIGKEIIEVKRLDSIFEDFYNPSDKVYMKIDTQGFESKILKGADKSLSKISLIQLEMSLVPLYDGESLFNDLYSLLFEKGFKLIAIDPGFHDQKAGQLLQVDGFFYRT